MSGRMVLKEALLLGDIIKLGVEGVNRIRRDVRLQGVGMKRAKPLVTAAEYSIGGREAARMELGNLLKDMDVYASRQEELLLGIEEKPIEVPYIDKLLAIKGIGTVTVGGFIAEVVDIGCFDSSKQLQKLAGYAIVANESGRHSGESWISFRGRKRRRYVLYEVAISLIGKNAELREIHEYYRTWKENPLKKMQSVMAVACKALRIFCAILTKRVDYDPRKLLRRQKAIDTGGINSRKQTGAMHCHGRVELSASPRLRVEFSCDRKVGRHGEGAGKCPPEGAVSGAMLARSVRLNTKNEPVVSRIFFIGHDLAKELS